MNIPMKIAIILFNLGGPDSLDAVQPFLRNLFSDPAIITLPTWLRLPLASFIALAARRRRAASTSKIGGGSPIVGQTEAQARALEEALGTRARMARLCLHALLASDDRRGGALGPALRARPHRAAAALSAILDDDDGVVVQRLEEGLEFQGASGRDRELSDRARLHPRLDRAGEAGPRRSRRWSQARAVLRPWPAGEDHQGRRSLSGAGRADRRGDRPASRWSGLVGLLPEPGRPAEMDRPADRGRDPARRRPTGQAWCSIR